MQRNVFFVALGLMFSSLLSAQGTAPKELDRFEPLLGNWKGKGKFYMNADDAGADWTGVSTTKKVLGGFCIQEDMRVDTGAPAPLVFRTLIYWNGAQKSYRMFSAANLGFDGDRRVFFSSDNEVISSSTEIENGVPFTTQNITKFDKERYTFLIRRSMGSGAFFKHVTGEFERGGDGYDATSDKEALVPPLAPMDSLQPMLGKWRFEGEVTMAPGAQPFKVSGNEEFSKFLGGHAILGTVRGDPVAGLPGGYEAQILITWEAGTHRYRSFVVSNYGEAATTEGHLIDGNRLVFLGTGVQYGQPVAHRSVLTWNAEKRTMSTRAHASRGSDEPYVGFQSKLTPRKAKESAK